ncbi:MAG: rhomboid family intramembrane serine protease [bacterium]
MEKNSILKKDKMMMSLVHYFVTQEAYVPIVVNGTSNEIWLENSHSNYQVIRINSNYIHNDEQANIDGLKVKHVLKQIRRRSYFLRIKALNIHLDVADRVNLFQDKTIEAVAPKNINQFEEDALINSIFPNIKDSIKRDNTSFSKLLSLNEDVNKMTQNRNQNYENIFSEGKPILTYFLIFLCIVIFIANMLTNNFIYYLGINNSTLVEKGQYYRLFTCIFMHADFIHLFFNMYALYILGRQVENYIGKIKFLIIFILSGIIGSAFSIIVNPGIFALGASGAIFGLASALVYLGLHYRSYLSRLLAHELMPVILINLFIGFTVSSIDNAAHIGGLVAGYLIASSFFIDDRTNRSEQKNSFIALITLLLFLTYLIVF